MRSALPGNVNVSCNLYQDTSAFHEQPKQRETTSRPRSSAEGRLMVVAPTAQQGTTMFFATSVVYRGIITVATDATIVIKEDHSMDVTGAVQVFTMECSATSATSHGSFMHLVMCVAQFRHYQLASHPLLEHAARSVVVLLTAQQGMKTFFATNAAYRGSFTAVNTVATAAMIVSKEDRLMGVTRVARPLTKESSATSATSHTLFIVVVTIAIQTENMVHASTRCYILELLSIKFCKNYFS